MIMYAMCLQIPQQAGAHRLNHGEYLGLEFVETAREELIELERATQQHRLVAGQLAQGAQQHGAPAAAEPKAGASAAEQPAAAQPVAP